MKEDRFYRNFLIVVGTVIGVGIIYQGRNLLSPVFSALLIAYIIYPIVLYAQKIGIPKGMTIIVIFITILGLITQMGSTVIPAVNREVRVLSNPSLYKDVYKDVDSRLIKIGKDLSRQLRQFGLIRKTWKNEQIIKEFSRWIAEQSTFLLTSIGGIAKKTGQFLMIFFFVLVFALLDGDKFYKTTVQMLPNSLFEPGLFILKKTIDLLGYYLRGIVIENLILGAISFVLLLLLSLISPLSFVLALVISIIIAITNVIRIIGPIIGAIIGVLLVLITTTDFIAMLGIVGVVLIVQLLDNVLILPLVMKEQVKIHPVFCVLGVLLGGQLAGGLGMIVAIPTLGSIKVIYRILAIEIKKFNMDPEAPLELGFQASES